MSNLVGETSVMGGMPFGGGFGFGGGWGGGIAPFGLFGLAGIGGRGLFGGNDGCCDGGKTGTLANDALLLNMINNTVDQATTPLALGIAGIREQMQSDQVLGAISAVGEKVCDTRADLVAFASNTACQFQGVNHRFDDLNMKLECMEKSIIQANVIAELEERLRCSERRGDDAKFAKIEDSVLVIQNGLANVLGTINNLPLSLAK